jgi:hypothetical protein
MLGLFGEKNKICREVSGFVGSVFHRKGAESAACFAKASQPEESAEGKYREFD